MDRKRLNNKKSKTHRLPIDGKRPEHKIPKNFKNKETNMKYGEITYENVEDIGNFALITHFKEALLLYQASKDSEHSATKLQRDVRSKLKSDIVVLEYELRRRITNRN